MKKTILFTVLCFVFLVTVANAQTQTGYCPYDPKIVPPKHLGEFSRVFRTLIVEVGTDGSFYIPISNTAVTGSGTAGRVGTSTVRDGSTCALFGWDGTRWVIKQPGTTTVTEIGSVLPGSLSAYLLANGGTLTNGSLAGTTTLPPGSQIIADGRVITSNEVSWLDGLTELLTVSLAAKEDDANKGAANGYASLDANSKVVENPASGTSTPGISKIPISEGDGYLNDGWIDPNVRVGSTSVSGHNDVNFPTTVGNSQVLMYNSGTGQWENNTSTASIAWGGITGNPNDQTDTLMSQAEAEGGTTTTSRMPSALRMSQAVKAQNGTTTPQVVRIKIGTTTVGNGALIEGTRLTNIDTYTKLSLPMDNPGTSTFSDNSDNRYTITANGNVIGTSTAKFGGGAGYFDGTGDYLSAADSPDWALTNTFTIDFWARFDNTNQHHIVGQRVDNNNMWNFYYSAGNLYFQQNVAASTNIDFSVAWTPSTNTWYHVALVDNGGTHTVFIDGTQQGSPLYDADTIADIAAALTIGESGAISGMQGHFDEFRISKGIARWTGNFTAPTAGYAILDSVAFTDIAGDGSDNVCWLFGSNTTTTRRNVEVASGKTTLADSWDTRCDPDLKEVISEDPLLADQAYNELKQAQIKRWKFKGTDHEITGIMIDDPHIPEDIIWRLDDGKPGGFNGTGFLNFLYSAIKSLITKTEQQKTEIDELRALLQSK